MAYEPLELEIQPPYIGSAVSPEVDVTETADEITVTITDFRGEHSYTLTKTDQAIADAQAATRDASTAAANANEKATAANQAATSATQTAGQATTAAQNADSAASSANGAAAQANSATSAANAATASANAATADAQAATADAMDATERAEAAIDAMGDISELAVPLMAEDTRGGAMLGSGLKVDGGKLSLGDIVTDQTDGPIYSADAEGWAEQDTTTGKNLMDEAACTPKKFVSKNTGGLGDSNGWSATDYIAVSAGQSYMLSGIINTWSGVAGTAFYDSSKTFISDSSIGSQVYQFTAPEGAAYARVSLNTETVSGVQLEAGSTATDYEPYTGGKPSPSPDYPQEVRVARGRNLLEPNSIGSGTQYGITRTQSSDGSVVFSGTSTAQLTYRCNPLTLQPGTYALSGCPAGGSSSKYFFFFEGQSIAYDYGSGATFSLVSETTLTPAFVIRSGQTLDSLTFAPQLESGTTPTPYVPYGHVGLEVRDSSDELVSVTPIPLPQKGFAAALPDGTADALSVDSAGSCEWTGNVANRTSADGIANITTQSDDTVSFVAFGNTSTPNALCNVAQKNGENTQRIAFSGNSNALYMRFAQSVVGTTYATIKEWLDANCELYYGAVSPTTESTYIDLPTIPEGATITIPELESVGVRCFVPGARELAEHADNWGKRCKANEDRIAALEAAIAELA